MHITIHSKEHNARAWGWKVLTGPAGLLDGLCETLTFGFVSLGVKLAVSRRLALARATSHRCSTVRQAADCP